MKIALVQFEITPMDPLTNLTRIEEFVTKAKKKGADLVVFPEDAVCAPLQGQTAFVQYAPAYLQRCRPGCKHAVDLVPAHDGCGNGYYTTKHTTFLRKRTDQHLQKDHLWETEKVSIARG